MKQRLTILFSFIILISVTFCNFNKESSKDPVKEKTVQQQDNKVKSEPNSNSDTKTNPDRYPIKKKYTTEDNKSNDGCTYWITSSSHKRHNKSCRWYKNSNGYCTDKQEGVACKICGG
jgi:hypothetical protein